MSEFRQIGGDAPGAVGGNCISHASQAAAPTQ